ncbi:MAG: NYN domain-containing protein [Ignavibacteriales bacterium]|nr:NYN domain-containing protein [Ignavibacteriales bacterium]
MQHFIIDGYNVIHSIPSLKKTLAHDAQSARELFIHSVAQLTHQRKFRCTIVFDGSAPTDAAKQSPHAPVHVLYSFPQTADAKIKQMIEQSKNRSLLVIVSSDREIQNFARVCSCQTHSSKHFANLLSQGDDSVTEKSDTSLSQTQINEWLKIFGEKS